MIGTTGVGNTEIARRLAKLSGAPFIKVEASKFTEVGYVGRDVESMIRDLTDLAVDMVRMEMQERVREKTKAIGEEKILDILIPPVRKRAAGTPPPVTATDSTAGFNPDQDDARELNEPTRARRRQTH